MAETTQETEAEQSKPRSAMTEAEKSLLQVTILGTLAANILTVLIIALALLIAKGLAKLGMSGVMPISGGVSALVLVLMLTRLKARKRWQMPMGAVAILLGWSLILVYFLGLLGFAAGVK